MNRDWSDIVLTFLERAMLLAWALWLGGIVTIFLCAQALFARFADNREVAGAATSSLFLVFARYQLVLAAVALIATAIWRWRSPGRRATVFFTLLALATIAAVISGGWITPQLETMRLEGTTKQPRFGQLHGLSMLLFTAEAVLLLIGGLLFSWRSASSESDQAAPARHTN